MKTNNTTKATGTLIRAGRIVSEPIESKYAKFKLDELQGYVGGYIERVEITWMGKPHDMLCNEDGKIKGLPINTFATDVANIGQLIVGDVVILRKGAW